MANKASHALIPLEVIESKLRSHRMVIDRDLADLTALRREL